MTDASSEQFPLVGALDDVPIEVIVKTLSHDQTSAQIRVSHEGDLGTLSLRSGQIVAANFRGVSGQEAVVRLLSLDSGSYRVELEESQEEGELSQHSLVDLVVEAQKRRARIETLALSLGGPGQIFHVDLARLRQRLEQIPDEVNQILQLCDGNRTLGKVLARSQFDEVTTLRIIERLLFMQVLSIAPVPFDAGQPRLTSWADVEEGAEEGLAEELPVEIDLEDSGEPAAAKATSAVGVTSPEEPEPAAPALNAEQALEWLERQLRLSSHQRTDIKRWQDVGVEGTPVLARWTEYPRVAAQSAFDDGSYVSEPASSIVDVLSDPASTNRRVEASLTSWLDPEEEDFFSRLHARNLEYERSGHRPDRDWFVYVLGGVALLGVLVTIGLFVLRQSSSPEDRVNAMIRERAESDAEVIELKAPPIPIVVVPAGEARVQTPLEATIDSVRGIPAERSLNVVELGQPLVTVIRDVEALSGAKEAPEPQAADVGTQEAPPPDETPRTSPETAPPPPPKPPAEPPPPSRPAQIAAARQQLPEPEGPDDGQVEPDTSPEPGVAEVPQPASPPPPVTAPQRPDFDSLFEEAARLYKSERLQESLEAYEAARDLQPRNAEVYAAIGQIFFDRGDIDAALEQYAKAESLAPKLAKVQLLMGLALHEDGQYAQARSRYQRYLELAPNGKDATAVRAILETLQQ